MAVARSVSDGWDDGWARGTFPMRTTRHASLAIAIVAIPNTKVRFHHKYTPLRSWKLRPTHHLVLLLTFFLRLPAVGISTTQSRPRLLMYPAYLRGVPPTPASAPRTPVPSSTSSARAHGAGLERAEIGCAATFTVEALDPYGERRNLGGDVVVARLMVGSDVTVEAFSLDNTDGTFTCTYVPKSVDTRQKLAVTVNGIPVRGSPFRPSLTAGPVAAKACTAAGERLYDSVAGEETTLIVQARDCFGNPRRAGGDQLKLTVRAVQPNRVEYVDVFRTFEFVKDAVDLGDGTYALTWQADIPGGYDLHVTLDRSPIMGSPFRCYLSSAFVRPPIELSASLMEYTEKAAKTRDGRVAKSRETAVPAASEAPAATMVDGQLIALSTALSTPKAAHRWPSAHTCQFKCQYKSENVYIAQPVPPCRWRSCLLPSHSLGAKHTLVGGPSSVYVLTQSHGAAEPIDEVACCEVIGGGAWRPPQTFVQLRVGGPSPQAVSGFCALYTPPIHGVRPPLSSPPAVAEPPRDDDDEDEDEPPPKPPPAEEGEGEDAEQEGDRLLSLPPCVWLLGGCRPDGMHATIDIYNVEEERWMGDPLEFEAGGAGSAPAVANAMACAVPAPDHNTHLYRFGGRSQNTGLCSDMWIFDVRAMAWAKMEGDGMPPDPRESGTMTRVLTRFLFVYGGVGADAQPMADVSLFDLKTRSWSVHVPSPALPRLGHVAGYASGSLYIFGGTDSKASDSELHVFDCDALFPQTAALSFDQDPGKVMVVKPSPSLNAISDTFTVECWVRPKSFPLLAPAVVKSAPNCSNGFGLVALDEATARKYVQIEKEKVKEGGVRERNPWENCLGDAELLPTVAFFVSGFKKETCALMRVAPDQWSHLAATFDGKQLVSYVNGRRADLITPDPVLEEVAHPKDAELYVGAMPGKIGWDGLVDAVRVWNCALSWEQVREHMNDTLKGPEHKDLVGQWSANEGAGSVMWDSSSRGNHGELEGDVQRVMCTRDRIEPSQTKAEQHVEHNFERLRTWRLDFEKRMGRPVTQADLLLADETVRKTARRLGLIA